MILITSLFLFCMSVIDYKTMYIPILLTYSFVLYAFILSMFSSNTLFLILGAVTVYLICIYLNNKEYLGKADTKIYTGIALLHGLLFTLNVLATSFGLLLMISLVHKKENRIPFAPVISIVYFFFYLI